MWPCHDLVRIELQACQYGEVVDLDSICKPHSTAEKVFEGLSDGAAYDLIRGNTITLLGLDLK